MTLEYKIDEEDFLDHLLFTDFQSDRVRKKIRGDRLWAALAFGVAAVLCYFFNILLAVYFGVNAIVYGLFYPKYFRWQKKRLYKSVIRENYPNCFGNMEYLEIRNEAIFSRNKIGESIINMSAVEKVDETERHFFVKIISKDSLIIPKYKIPNADEVRTKFESLGVSVNKGTNSKQYSIHNER